MDRVIQNGSEQHHKRGAAAFGDVDSIQSKKVRIMESYRQNGADMTSNGLANGQSENGHVDKSPQGN